MRRKQTEERRRRQRRKQRERARAHYVVFHVTKGEGERVTRQSDGCGRSDCHMMVAARVCVCQRVCANVCVCVYECERPGGKPTNTAMLAYVCVCVCECVCVRV